MCSHSASAEMVQFLRVLRMVYSAPTHMEDFPDSIIQPDPQQVATPASSGVLLKAVEGRTATAVVEDKGVEADTPGQGWELEGSEGDMAIPQQEEDRVHTLALESKGLIMDTVVVGPRALMLGIVQGKGQLKVAMVTVVDRVPMGMALLLPTVASPNHIKYLKGMVVAGFQHPMGLGAAPPIHLKSIVEALHRYLKAVVVVLVPLMEGPLKDLVGSLLKHLRYMVALALLLIGVLPFCHQINQ